MVGRAVPGAVRLRRGGRRRGEFCWGGHDHQRAASGRWLGDWRRWEDRRQGHDSIQLHCTDVDSLILGFSDFISLRPADVVVPLLLRDYTDDFKLLYHMLHLIARWMSVLYSFSFMNTMALTFLTIFCAWLKFI